MLFRSGGMVEGFTGGDHGEIQFLEQLFEVILLGWSLGWLVDSGYPFQGLAHDFKGSRIHKVVCTGGRLCAQGSRVARVCERALVRAAALAVGSIGLEGGTTTFAGIGGGQSASGSSTRMRAGMRWGVSFLGVVGDGVWQHRGMNVNHTRNGGVPKLWCVEMVPKRRKFGRAEMEKVVRLGRGMPSDRDEAFMWMVQVVAGLEDHRGADFARVHQRLVVFTDRKEAVKRARKETNKFWYAKVRPVNVM